MSTTEGTGADRPVAVAQQANIAYLSDSFKLDFWSISCCKIASNNLEMASLLALPCEISLQITRHLGIDDQINLSAVCRPYRARLLPVIFSKIRFTNTEASSTSAVFVAQAHGQHVKAIEFTCILDHLDDVMQEVILPALMPAAYRLLRGSLTPNLETIRLNFVNLTTNNWRDNFDSIHVEEDAARTFAEELDWQWRALLNETWEALASNPLVRKLVLDELPPKWTSTYYTDAFRQFLGQLESATFSLFGFNDWSSDRTNMGSGCHAFLRDLDALFFQYMTGLKQLRIRASDPLGLDDNIPYVPLALKPESFPLLRSLTLEGCFICPELVSFIHGHAQTLASLDVNECFSHYSHMSWAKFFDEIFSAKPRLVELKAGGGRAPFFGEEKPDEPPDEAVLGLFQELLQKMETDADLIVFGHIWLDEDCGTIVVDAKANVERYHQGDDQRAYDRVMRLVIENRAHT